jgi:hypothetical protein
MIRPMSTINLSALVAAQVYSTATQPQRQPAPARAQAKTDETPRFQVEDKVQTRSRTEDARPPEGPQNSTPARPKRPGSLVDIKA